MLLPNFTIRAILILTDCVAFVALLVQLSLRGQYWAGGLAAAIVAAIITMLVFAATFLLFEIVGPPRRKQVLAERPAAPAAPATQDGQAEAADKTT